MEWLSETPCRLEPAEAMLFHLYGVAGSDLTGLSQELTSTFHQVFGDPSALEGGAVRMTEEAFDLLCHAAGLSEELSLNPDRWPSREHAPSAQTWDPEP
ncbi:hypothetical protein AD930_06730 [Acetobacter malorum]|nr:hypothetical protein AD930_06730 [Acetobacter malorum]